MELEHLCLTGSITPHTCTLVYNRVVALLVHQHLKGKRMDLLLDTRTHDIVFTNGPPAVTTTPVQHVSQRLKIKLLTFKGEWFQNLIYGVPYRQEILGHKVSKSRIDRIFQEAILAEKGVKEITRFESRIAGRTYHMEFTVRTSSGETSTIEINNIGV